MTEPAWKETGWWRAIGPDGKLWAEASDETEVRGRARPGDTIELQMRRVDERWIPAAPAVGPKASDIEHIVWHDTCMTANTSLPGHDLALMAVDHPMDADHRRKILDGIPALRAGATWRRGENDRVVIRDMAGVQLVDRERFWLGAGPKVFQATAHVTELADKFDLSDRHQTMLFELASLQLGAGISDQLPDGPVLVWAEHAATWDEQGGFYRHFQILVKFRAAS